VNYQNGIIKNIKARYFRIGLLYRQREINWTHLWVFDDCRANFSEMWWEEIG